MPKERNQTIADTMFIYNRATAFWQVAVIAVVGENFLKTAPKGFSKDYPYLKYLQCKEYTVSCHQPDSFFLAPDFLERTDDIFRQLKRFSDFVNYTIDDFE